jgi:FtsZ-binding cell division protein ZapB
MNVLQKITVSCLVCYGQMITGGEMGSKRLGPSSTEGRSAGVVQRLQIEKTNKEGQQEGSETPAWGSKADQKLKVAQFVAQQKLKKEQAERGDTDIQGLNKQEPISSSSATAASSSLQNTRQELLETDRSIESILQKFKRPVDDEKTKRIGIDIEQIASNFDTWIKTIEATSWKSCATDILNELKSNNHDYIMIEFMNDNNDHRYAEFQYNLLTNRMRQYFFALNKKNKIKPDGSFDQNLAREIEAALQPPTAQEINTIGNQLFEEHARTMILEDLGLQSPYISDKEKKDISVIIDKIPIAQFVANLQKSINTIKQTQQEINTVENEKATLKATSNDNQRELNALRRKQQLLKTIRNTYIAIGSQFLKRTFDDANPETIQIANIIIEFEKISANFTTNEDTSWIAQLNPKFKGGLPDRWYSDWTRRSKERKYKEILKQ